MGEVLKSHKTPQCEGGLEAGQTLPRNEETLGLGEEVFFRTNGNKSLLGHIEVKLDKMCWVCASLELSGRSEMPADLAVVTLDLEPMSLLS